jgi:primase-polymerase (primpol)-like protein
MHNASVEQTENECNAAPVIDFDSIPEELKSQDHWVLFELEPPTEKNPRWSKDPRKVAQLKVGGDNRKNTASSRYKSHWCSFEKAKMKLEEFQESGDPGWTLGFALKDSGLVALDLDDCVRKDGPSAAAKVLLNYFHSHTALSLSGAGYHVLIRADLQAIIGKDRHKKDLSRFCAAMAGHSYITMGGPALPEYGTEIVNRHKKLEQWFQEDIEAPAESEDEDDSILQRVIFTDEQVIEKASNAKNGRKFKGLFYGDEEVMKEYPRPDGTLDCSAMDAALLLLIQFWTRDVEQINRIYKKSILYLESWKYRGARWEKEKWDSKKWDGYRADGKTYGTEQIGKSLEFSTAMFDPDYGKRKIDVLDIRDRYVYISGQNELWDRHAHLSICKDAFNAVNQKDFTGSKQTPFSGLMNDPLRQVANNYTWIPGADEFVKQGNRTLYNTYRPTELIPTPGDVRVWLRELKRLIPDRETRKYLIRRMAWDVQHPDQKCNVQVLLAGKTPGTGKDTILQPWLQAVGMHNVKLSSDADFDDDFNYYAYESKIVFIPEAMNFHKREAGNRLKALAASPPNTILINLKNKQKFEVLNLISIVMTSQYPDSLHLEEGDRRWHVIWVGTNEIPTREHFEKVYKWYEEQAGYEKCLHFLKNVDLTKFNSKQPPVDTDHKREMIHSSLTDLEQRLKEAIDNYEDPFDQDFVIIKHVKIRMDLSESCKAIAKSLRTLGGEPRTVQKMNNNDKKNTKLWLVRNIEKYENERDCALWDRFMPEISIRREVAKRGYILEKEGENP